MKNREIDAVVVPPTLGAGDDVTGTGVRVQQLLVGPSSPKVDNAMGGADVPGGLQSSGSLLLYRFFFVWLR